MNIKSVQLIFDEKLREIQSRIPVPLGENRSFEQLFDEELKKTTSVKNTSSLSNITSYDSLIEKASAEHGIDAALIKAVIDVESGFDPSSLSSKGAVGLMQLMPDTAKGLGLTNPTNPEQNIFGGTKYLKNQLDRFHGNVSLALAAYNAGPGSVIKYGGIPPYEETQNYVRKVLEKRQLYEQQK